MAEGQAGATKLTLADAVEALVISESWLEEAGGELTPEIEAILEQAEGDLKDKVERVALKVRQLEGMAKAIEDEADRLYARAKARANGAKSLKAYLERCLEAAGLTRVDGLLVTVAMQKNAPAVQVPPDADLAELRAAGFPYLRVIPEKLEVDKKALLDAAKANAAALPTGWAITQGQSVRIR